MAQIRTGLCYLQIWQPKPTNESLVQDNVGMCGLKKPKKQQQTWWSCDFLSHLEACRHSLGLQQNIDFAYKESAHREPRASVCKNHRADSEIQRDKHWVTGPSSSPHPTPSLSHRMYLELANYCHVIVICVFVFWLRSWIPVSALSTSGREDRRGGKGGRNSAVWFEFKQMSDTPYFLP